MGERNKAALLARENTFWKSGREGAISDKMRELGKKTCDRERRLGTALRNIVKWLVRYSKNLVNDSTSSRSVR